MVVVANTWWVWSLVCDGCGHWDVVGVITSK